MMFKPYSTVLLALALTMQGVASDTVRVTVPASLTFSVGNVSSNTTASPDPSSVTFLNAALNSGRVLRISVRALSTVLSGPGGTAIPISRVSWTISGAAGGSGSAGAL